MYSVSYLEPVCCSMSSSNCCFLTSIQISQEVGQVVWYSHLFQNFPQFIVIHTVKGFGIINRAEIDVFLELFCFFDDPADVSNLISGSSAFSKTSLNIWKLRFMYCWSLAWRILSIYLLLCEMSASLTLPQILINAIEWSERHNFLILIFFIQMTCSSTLRPTSVITSLCLFASI